MRLRRKRIRRLAHEIRRLRISLKELRQENRRIRDQLSATRALHTLLEGSPV